MSKLQRIRHRAMSLRGGIAVGGALAIAVSLTQVAGTLAAPDLEPTATLPIASANYFPTPLVTNVKCDKTGTAGLRYAEVSWNPPSVVQGATPVAYRYRIDRVDSSNSVKDTQETSATTTGRFRIGGTIRTERVRIYTINPNPSNVVSSGFASHAVYSAAALDTYCSGGPLYDAPNQPWENSQNWLPGATSFRVAQPLMDDPRVITAEVNGAEVALDNDGIFEGVAAEASGTAAPASNSTTATPSATSTSTLAPRTNTSVSPTRPPSVKPTTSSSSTYISLTTTAPSASTTRASTTTSTTVPATASSVALPGGGEAEIVGGTTLVVSDAAGDVCTAKVRGGSTLKVRSGVLEVTDAVETRAVDQETCKFT